MCSHHSFSLCTEYLRSTHPTVEILHGSETTEYSIWHHVDENLSGDILARHTIQAILKGANILKYCIG